MLDLLIHSINTNPLFIGLSTMAMQIGGRYMSAEIPAEVEKIFNTTFFRRLFIFFIVFLAFRDIRIAMFVTLLFIIIFNYLLSSKSKVYIGKFFGANEKKDEPKIITQDEVENAKKIIMKYNQSLESQKIHMDRIM